MATIYYTYGSDPFPRYAILDIQGIRSGKVTEVYFPADFKVRRVAVLVRGDHFLLDRDVEEDLGEAWFENPEFVAKAAKVLLHPLPERQRVRITEEDDMYKNMYIAPLNI